MYLKSLLFGFYFHSNSVFEVDTTFDTYNVNKYDTIGRNTVVREFNVSFMSPSFSSWLFVAIDNWHKEMFLLLLGTLKTTVQDSLCRWRKIYLSYTTVRHQYSRFRFYVEAAVEVLALGYPKSGTKFLVQSATRTRPFP